MKKLFLVDAYALIFKYYYAFLGRPMRNREGMNTSVVFSFVKFLRDIQKRERPDLLGVAFDPKGGSFRRDIFPEYKANRSETPEDILLSIPYVKRVLDAMCIPKGSRQKEAAEMYINFMCEPDIAYSNIDYICYSTPHSGAYEMLDEETRSNPVSYPGNDYLDENTTIFVNLSDEANLQMQTLWTEMKSAENETPNRWIVPVFLLLCLGLMIFVLIRRHIRNKKDIY